MRAETVAAGSSLVSAERAASDGDEGQRKKSCTCSCSRRSSVASWVDLSVYGEVLERFSIQGPWEISLALRDSRLAVLGNVAAEWAEPEETFPREEAPRCPDPNVLIVREALESPDPEGQRSLAFNIGSNMEGAPSDSADVVSSGG